MLPSCCAWPSFVVLLAFVLLLMFVVLLVDVVLLLVVFVGALARLPVGLLVPLAVENIVLPDARVLRPLCCFRRCPSCWSS